MAGWPAKMPATDDAIRCAMLTAESKYIGLGAEILVAAADGRVIQGLRVDKGWFVSLSHDGRVVSHLATRHGSKYDRPVPRSFIGRRIAGREMFGWQEVEDILKEFIASPDDPALVSWVGREQT